MDKEKFIKVLGDYESRHGNIFIEDAHDLLLSYCMENGKTQDDAIKLVHKVFTIPFIQLQCLNVAIEYYTTKFAITKLLSSPLANGQRKLLQIF